MGGRGWVCGVKAVALEWGRRVERKRLWTGVVLQAARCSLRGPVALVWGSRGSAFASWPPCNMGALSFGVCTHGVGGFSVLAHHQPEPADTDRSAVQSHDHLEQYIHTEQELRSLTSCVFLCCAVCAGAEDGRRSASDDGHADAGERCAHDGQRTAGAVHARAVHPDAGCSPAARDWQGRQDCRCSARAVRPGPVHADADGPAAADDADGRQAAEGRASSPNALRVRDHMSGTDTLLSARPRAQAQAHHPAAAPHRR
eukprot:2694839-Rhodomonas_salina.3